MNQSAKTQAFLAYTISVCQAVIARCNDPKDEVIPDDDKDKVSWRAEKLLESCKEAAGDNRLGKIDKSKWRQIDRLYKQIDAIGWMDGKFHLETTMAFLMIGLDGTRLDSVLKVVKRIDWFLRFFDPALNRHNWYEVAEREYYAFHGATWKREQDENITWLWSEEARELWAA